MCAFSGPRRLLLAGRGAARAIAAPVLAVLIPNSSWAQERCEPAAARVVSVQGTVELQRQGTAAWTVLALDQALVPGRQHPRRGGEPGGAGARQQLDAAARSAHDAGPARRRRGTAIPAPAALRRGLFLQPSAARARGRDPVRQRRRRGHRVPGPRRRGSGRGGHARRPGAVVEPRRRAAGRKRGCGGCGRGRGAGADDRRAPARCGRLGAVLPAGAGALWPSARRGRAGCRRACRRRSTASPRTTTRARSQRSMPCPRPRAMPATGPTAPACC